MKCYVSVQVTYLLDLFIKCKEDNESVNTTTLKLDRLLITNNRACQIANSSAVTILFSGERCQESVKSMSGIYNAAEELKFMEW